MPVELGSGLSLELRLEVSFFLFPSSFISLCLFNPFAYARERERERERDSDFKVEEQVEKWRLCRSQVGTPAAGV